MLLLTSSSEVQITFVLWGFWGSHLWIYLLLCCGFDKAQIPFCNCKRFWLQTAICTDEKVGFIACRQWIYSYSLRWFLGLYSVKWKDSRKQVVPVRSASVNVRNSGGAEMAWDKHCGAKILLLPIHMKTTLMNDPYQFSLTCVSGCGVTSLT